LMTIAFPTPAPLVFDATSKASLVLSVSSVGFSLCFPCGQKGDY
jgi:hypothetical protein